ncbi:GNAT family N-acetyltransferase [Hamadaea tsunoensis]|uniref:GNAT family N-acetyltransferase n=1 Tax=Hamadaea tsunoensis TaxID=53368 RepID=UPI00041EA37E|nr:GNAT family N-acetyltransferase [Hamadaea tsunoensis]
MEITLRAARSGEAAELTELVLRSKAHWGYDQAFLDRVRPELTVRPDQIASTVVAERDGRPAGLVTLLGTPPEGHVDLLFVDPWAIGTGVGRRLFEDAAYRARAAGFVSLLIEADPQAEEFYLHLGAVRIGESISSSSGRSLPLLRLTLS